MYRDSLTLARSGATHTHQGVPGGWPALSLQAGRSVETAEAGGCGPLKTGAAGATAESGGSLRECEAPSPTPLRGATSSRSCKTSPVTWAAEGVCGALKRRCLDPCRSFGAPVRGPGGMLSALSRHGLSLTSPSRGQRQSCWLRVNAHSWSGPGCIQGRGKCASPCRTSALGWPLCSPGGCS